jgi:glycerol kinase
VTECVLALDQGTTSSRALIFDRDGAILAARSQEFEQLYLQPGWVEHDPDALWVSQISSARAALAELPVPVSQVAAIGIANQRETTVLWDRATGRPVHNAIVWQDRRTASRCGELIAAGWEEDIRQRTGLRVDPAFSGTKLAWLLDHDPDLRRRAERGQLAFGTVDAFLIHRLTGGQLHVTDTTNAARTLLFNIHTVDWDDDILRELRIPRALLPEVRSSSEIVGHTAPDVFGHSIPIAGVAGDQQAATFGQACFTPGMAKQTYGTGSFMLLNTGSRPQRSQHGLLTTIAWTIGGQTTYALEGYCFIAGAGVQWLRDALGILADAAESGPLAQSVASTGDVYFVPAFAGLGAPWWDAGARGTLLGLTRGSGRAHFTRAVLEAVAFQTRDILDAMEADSGIPLRELRVDGGMVANQFLMQFQADILGRQVVRPAVAETTALGAAYLAGLATGIWQDLADIAGLWQESARFTPQLPAHEQERRLRRWHQAINRAREWAIEEEE